MWLSNAQRCLIIKLYFSHNYSYLRIKNEFNEEYPDVPLTNMQIKQIIDKFEQHHTVSDLPKAGRPRIRTSQFQQQVAERLLVDHTHYLE